MYEQRPVKDLRDLQSAFDRFVGSEPSERRRSFADFERAIFDSFSHPEALDEGEALFSQEVPDRIQRFTASWLLRALICSPSILDFDGNEPLVALLFDRTLQQDVYPLLRLQAGAQTYEKLRSLSDYAQTILDAAMNLLGNSVNLDRLTSFQQSFQQILNSRQNMPFLAPLLPPQLSERERLANLFSAVNDYSSDRGEDRLLKRDTAVLLCDEFEQEALQYGTKDAANILGGLAVNLKTAVERHFDSLEAIEPPTLTFDPITKKYPLEQIGAEIVYRVRIRNEGTGPARDVRLDEVVFDDAIELLTGPTMLGTIQPGNHIDLDIVGSVAEPCSGAKVIAQFSWARPVNRDDSDHEFVIEAQRDDVDWSIVASTESYSLEAVTSDKDLIGRDAELNGLLRRANQTTVGSAYIYGQKRVGKTSLANALAETLKADNAANWVVITKGSGDYVSAGPMSTIKALGDVLVSEMRVRIPGLEDIDSPDFSNGLAPLSTFIDDVLRRKEVRLLFTLDEFDELPIELFQRTDVSNSLFQPLRQISNKPGCGFVLVGGESMQQIVNDQGDRFNRFRATRVDYFDKSSDWNDFSDLIRRPVQDWLTITDQALDRLFTFSAGNPYFAKLLAGQLAENMASMRHCVASEADMDVAISNALSVIGANSFAHFWTDGIVHDAENAEQIRLVRRAVMIAAGQSFRRNTNSNNETISAELDFGAGSQIGEARFQTALQDLLRRGILIEDEQKQIRAKIPLFQSWLTSRGVGELLADFREHDYLSSKLQDDEERRVSDDEVIAVCEKLGRYRGRAVEPLKVRQWLEQFGTLPDQRLMFRLLSHVKIYDEDLVRHKMGEAYGIVRRNLLTVAGSASARRSDIIVSFLDHSAAKSGPTYCRLFASENRIASSSVQPIDALENLVQGPEKFQKLVIIDDFCGTGGTIIDGLDTVINSLRLVNKARIQIVIVALVGFSAARDAIEKYIDDKGLDAVVYFCDELGDEDKAFSENSTIFADEAERERARSIAEAKGAQLFRRNPLGFRDTQATIVFYQSCPNNTLPIFWSASGDWVPLFPR